MPVTACARGTKIRDRPIQSCWLYEYIVVRPGYVILKRLITVRCGTAISYFQELAQHFLIFFIHRLLDQIIQYFFGFFR